MNIVTVNFQPCTPTPEGGYRLFWRVQGTEDAYTDAGVFTGSPAQFSDDSAEGTCYEGYLQSECGSGIGTGNSVEWLTPCVSEESGVINYSIARTGGPCGSSESNFTISGGNAGDTVKVRAFYAGSLQKTAGALATKAALSIFAGGGTYNLAASPCYANEFPNSFYITADTDIVMPGSSTTVTTTAEVFKSIDNYNFLNVAIIEVNGTPTYIVAAGCDAATDTEPSC